MRGVGAISQSPIRRISRYTALRLTSPPCSYRDSVIRRPYPYPALLRLQRQMSGLEEAALGYAWVGCEQQVAAAVKLIPLCQTAGRACSSGSVL